VLYNRYPYETSKSETMRQHFSTLIEDFRALLPSLLSVVEIGSNDGLFLRRLKESGVNHVLGIDPAKNLALVANQSGVPTLSMMFGPEAVEDAQIALGTSPDLIVARHCFCHIYEWLDFIRCAKRLMGSETLLYIEVPHAKKLLECGEFDTIYFEHASYLTVASMRALLKRAGDLSIVGIKEYPIHGGCIGILIRARKPENPSVVDWVHQEKCGLAQWDAFATNSHRRIAQLRTLVRELRLSGKTVAAYGASAKCTVWCNACQFARNDIAFVADTTKAKWHTTVPGTNIPVVDDGALIRELPDYAILFAWNFREEILAAKKEFYTDRGARFIIPTPEIAVVP
jgi:novobiocin biosynthesis protein NovU/D-mycarose 3-C-methyltransferase